jgi:hypothetical protein
MQTICVLLIFFTVSITGYIFLNHNIAAQTDTAQTTLSGQLSDFIALETDMVDSINSSDFTTAKSDADNLEHEWDTSAPILKNADKVTWTQIDGTIDDVLAAVRSKNPDAAKCLSVLNDSLNVLDSANIQ